MTVLEIFALQGRFRRKKFLRKTLINHGCRKKFIDIHILKRPTVCTVHAAPEKTVYLQVAFRDDQLLKDIRHMINSALSRTYPAAQPRLIPTSRRNGLDKSMYNQSQTTASHIIYLFVCSCHDIYIGRTDRRLSQRISEHIPKFLKHSMLLHLPRNKLARRNPTSSMAKHLLATSHIVDTISLFEVILSNPDPKRLAFSKTMLITLRNPILCSQMLTHSVQLPYY